MHAIRKISDSDGLQFLYQSVHMLISALKNGYFWLGVYVTSSISVASLKWTLGEQHILALQHCLIPDVSACSIYFK